MKKQLITMLAILIGLSAYAQKDELKSTDKALKNGDLATAKSSVDQAEGLIANADNKIKANFYFLKAKTYYDIAKKNPSLDANAFDIAAKSLQDLLAFEKQIGKAKYTEEAQPLLTTLIGDVSAKGIKQYQEKDYSNAKVTLYKTYALSKKDTAFLEYAATAAYLDKDYDLSLEHFSKLKEVGYTGIATTYTATNIESGKTESFGSKSQMDLMVKTGQYKEPKVDVSKSKTASVIKNIAWILVEKGEVENAMSAVKEARKVDPKDINMLLTEANLLLKLDKKDEFAALMKEAIIQDPNNAMLHFNVGVINQEQGNMEEAKGYYNKAIELDPNYSDAYLNLGAILLERDKVLVEEMNNNLSNFKKYDAIKARQLELYKEVLPYYEKAYVLTKEKTKEDDIDIVRTLMSMYENLEMNDKFKEMKAIWDASRS
ncbi:MAG: tetratricopeptide repeat protein [Aureibaculum sp.]|nr:tetratricopeptide repeat protein [Aureibaculum sp.]